MSLFARFSSIDMLHGSIWDKLVLFSLPLALTNVLQQLFNTADVAVLGRYVGAEAMAAVGSMTPVISLFVALFLGLSLGANVVVARHAGSGAKERLEASASTAQILALLLGLFSLFLAWPFASEIVGLLEVPKSIEDLSLLYLRYYLLGIPALSVYNFAAALLRARGDTTSPFISLAAASLLNIVLNLVATLVLGLGVMGVALATTLANYLSAILLVIRVVKRNDLSRTSLPRTFARTELSEMCRIGFPAAVQGMVFCFSNVIVQAAINSLGPIVIAASAAAFTLEINLYCLMSAFAQAATTFVSQNFGARNLARCLRVTRVTLALTVPVNLALSLCILLLARYILGFFTQDPAVLELGILRIWYIVLPNVVTIFIDVLSGALRGYGCSLPPAVATLVAICGIRIAWVFTIFRAHTSFEVLLASYPASWLATAILIGLVYLRFRRVVLLHGHSPARLKGKTGITEAHSKNRGV